MSLPTAVQHAIHAAMESHVNKCAAYSRLALLAYDILLNSGREKELIWGQQWRASTAIYFFLRYPVIAFQIFNVYASAYRTPQCVLRLLSVQADCQTKRSDSCDALYRFTWAVSIILTRLAITASFVLRVYAIMGLSKMGFILAAGLGAVGASTIGLDIWQDIQVSCATSSNPISTVLTFIILAAFDVLTTSILAIRAVLLMRESGWEAIKAYRLFSLLVNQGLVYFVTVSIVQITVIVLYYLPQGVYSLVLNNYSLLISSILLSRFVLDLREHHARPNHGVSTRSSQLTTAVTVKFSPRGETIDRTSAHGSIPGIVRDFEDPDDLIFAGGQSDATDWSESMEMYEMYDCK